MTNGVEGAAAPHTGVPAGHVGGASGKIDTQKPHFRTDIQALRGLAVLFVLFFHSSLGVAQSGYLGVDIFFVVSGFLITRIVCDNLDRGSFSFADFYARRARRLLPAGYCVLVATTIACTLLVGLSVFERFWEQLAGSVFFSANVVLWRQINYFHPAATYEPLLHMWSLAVEEQYYLLLPVCLWAAPRRLRLPLILIATGASLAAYAWLAAKSPGVAFYLLPTRAWELGLGSLGTFVVASPMVRRFARLLLWPALSVLIIVPFVPLPSIGFNPGLVAVCLATLVVILARHERLPGLLPARCLARVGDFSYSLYLVHWPIFAIAHNAYLTEQLPLITAVGGVVLSLALGYILYRWIEEPVRRSRIDGWRLLGIALAGSALVLAVGAGALHAKRHWGNSGVDLTGVTGFARCGSYDSGLYDGKCAEGPAPTMLVWGDSFSQHLVPGLAATTNRTIAQASKGHCGPFANLAAMQSRGERAFALSCLDFNRSVIDYVARTPSIQVVVLSGWYLRYLDPHFTLASQRTGHFITAPAGFDATLAAQRETVKALRSLGKRVVVVSGPPQADYDVGMCWERRRSGLPTFGARALCDITPGSTNPLGPPTDRLMDAFVQKAATPVIRLDQALCRGHVCTTQIDGQPIYRDGSHLGHIGSELLAARLALGERVWKDAR
ncbi:acyltransferase family protein [Allosphingosinicella deserti]|uniref:Acyltransferase n=1 Tax=Allosphingosinicella deserti TaxID=2116704 RepID=A0A2P7QUS6_9SPHN|nr:acyltransferase family protein [Sphingomonas deserti]PSJ41719.1 acyltransferase [Sphingomonas deserti]